MVAPPAVRDPSRVRSRPCHARRWRGDRGVESEKGKLHEEGELHHLFIFDIAWPVFVLSGLLALTTGVGGLAGGAMRRSPRAVRYGVWAVGYCALAVVVVIFSEALSS